MRIKNRVCARLPAEPPAERGPIPTLFHDVRRSTRSAELHPSRQHARHPDHCQARASLELVQQLLRRSPSRLATPLFPRNRLRFGSAPDADQMAAALTVNRVFARRRPLGRVQG
jgi:hypothetical protein